MSSANLQGTRQVLSNLRHRPTLHDCKTEQLHPVYRFHTTVSGTRSTLLYPFVLKAMLENHITSNYHLCELFCHSDVNHNYQILI